MIQNEKPKRLFIDVGGVGAGLYDRLIEMGHADVVRSVNFASSPMEPEPLDENGKPKGGPLNRRCRDVAEVERVAGGCRRRADP